MRSAVRKSSRTLVGKAVRPLLATALSVAVLAVRWPGSEDSGKDDKGALDAGATVTAPSRLPSDHVVPVLRAPSAR